MSNFTKSSNKFYSFISTCYDSVKDTIKSYHAYASNYDAHQSKQYADESNYDPFLVTSVTQSMEILVSQDNDTTYFNAFKDSISSLSNSVVYGMFTTVNNIRAAKKKLLVQKQPVKEMRGFGVDFKPFIERDPELTFRMHSAKCQVRDSFLLKDKKTDFVWGFVDD
ncbi:hypothetical protein BDF21DRAFT_431799, partial [Thamnidium elegans]